MDHIRQMAEDPDLGVYSTGMDSRIVSPPGGDVSEEESDPEFTTHGG